jgi:hypothetical protein
MVAIVPTKGGIVWYVLPSLAPRFVGSDSLAATRLGLVRIYGDTRFIPARAENAAAGSR